MFYTRINKIRVFDNHEGFPGLFNKHAGLQIYSLASNPTGMSGHFMEVSVVYPQLTVGDLIGLGGRERKDRLLEAVLTETDRFAQSVRLKISDVKDNQSLFFGEAGTIVYQNKRIPDVLDLQFWVVESDKDARRLTLDAGTVADSDAFKRLLTVAETALHVAETALHVANPVLSDVISVRTVVTGLLRQKLRAGKDDLAGYWQTTLNRAEHYPHGLRDRQDTPDTTGNIQVDYTLFGFEDKL